MDSRKRKSKLMELVEINRRMDEHERQEAIFRMLVCRHINYMTVKKKEIEDIIKVLPVHV